MFHIFEYFRDEFIEKLESEKGGLTPTMKMKLLNINASAKHLLEGYKGPFLKEDGPVFSVPMARNKSKQIIVNGMLDALKSLLSSSTYVKTLVDSKMGFLIGKSSKSEYINLSPATRIIPFCLQTLNVYWMQNVILFPWTKTNLVL